MYTNMHTYKRITTLTYMTVYVCVCVCVCVHTQEKEAVLANTTDPSSWGELGPQLGGYVMAYVNKTYNLGVSSFGENIPGGSPPGVPLYRYTYTCSSVTATSASHMGTCRILQYENSGLSNNSWYHIV